MATTEKVMPVYEDAGVRLFCGDALSVLRSMPDESVQCVVTSPPYFGLRDYGVDGQLGLESAPAEYVQALVEISREVRRVLRADGTCWLNLGDSYAGSWGNYHPNSPPGKHGQRKKDSERFERPGYQSQEFLPPTANLKGFKPKDLCGIPWRVAFALQDDGWWLRQDIIWSKPNPMPESVTDRCTKAHEYIFLLTKSRKYYFNQDSIREPLKDASIARLNPDLDAQEGSERVPGKMNGNMKAVRFGGSKYGDNDDFHTHSGNEWKPRYKNLEANGQKNHSFHESREEGKEWRPKGRDRSNGNRNGEGASTLDTAESLSANKKSVWTVTTQPFKDAHFATFPPKLIEPRLSGLLLALFARKTAKAELSLLHCGFSVGSFQRTALSLMRTVALGT
jgi:DNA modification methylase